MSKEEQSLTRILINVTKWSGKLGFYFFMISAILVAITISDADPSISYYDLNAGQQKTVQYIHLDSRDNAQIFFSINTDEMDHSVTLGDVTPKKITVSLIDQSSEEVKWSVTASEYFKTINLGPGDYRIVVSATEDNTRFVMGSGSFNPGLVGITTVFIAMFGVLMAIFWTVLPFTIAALIIRSINNQKQPILPNAPSQKVAPQKINLQTPATVTKRSVTIHPESFFSKLTRNDWILVGIAVLFFFIFIVERDAGFFVVTIIFSSIVFYLVTEREKTKRRILVLLNHYPTTTIEFLSQQLGKKTKEVVNILQIMILDDAQQITLDPANNTVKVIGDLDMPKEVYPTASSVTQKVTPQTTQKPVEVKQAPTTTKQVKNEMGNVISHCTGCGEPLVGSVKYCYSCGQKQA